MIALQKCHKALSGLTPGMLICKETTRYEEDPVTFHKEQCMTLYTKQEIIDMLKQANFDIVLVNDKSLSYGKDMDKCDIFAARPKPEESEFCIEIES